MQAKEVTLKTSWPLAYNPPPESYYLIIIHMVKSRLESD